tara:strand:- start:305 stop:1084 length:780 start_codon:yes stop_codon:yes gene_type:complete
MYKNHSHRYYNTYYGREGYWVKNYGYFEKDRTYVNCPLEKKIDWYRNINEKNDQLLEHRIWIDIPSKKSGRNFPREKNEHILDWIDNYGFQGKLVIYKNGIVTKYIHKDFYHYHFIQIDDVKKIYPEYIINHKKNQKYTYYSYNYIQGENFIDLKLTRKIKNKIYIELVKFLKEEYKKILPYCKRVYQISDVIFDDNMNMHLIDREEILKIKDKNILKIIYDEIENIGTYTYLALDGLTEDNLVLRKRINEKLYILDLH